MVVGENEKRSNVYCFGWRRKSVALLRIRFALVVRERYTVMDYLIFGAMNDATRWNPAQIARELAIVRFCRKMSTALFMALG